MPASRRIALFTCSNGYGHIRRMLLLSEILLGKERVAVDLYAPFAAVKKLNKTMLIQLPRIVNFDSNTSKNAWLNGEAGNWIEKLPNLDSYDAIVSDNLLEILNVRSDAWISGSFLWYESMQNIPSTVVMESKRIIDLYKPRIISSRLFTSSTLKKYEYLYEVGLFSNINNERFIKVKKTDALISCGKGGGVENEIKIFVHELVRKDKPPFDTVWIEPSILPKNHPNWMRAASYDSFMYSRLSVALIRPGVGTVTDVLSHGGRIFSLYESGNKEMIDNAKNIALKGIGLNVKDINLGWENAVNYFNSTKYHENQIKKISEINFNGAEQATDIILNSIN